MVSIKVQNFDFKQICNSGQCFRLKELTGDCDGALGKQSFEIIAGDKYLLAAQTQLDGETHLELSCSEEEYSEFWRHYLDLEADYGRYIAAVDPEDDYLLRAVKYGSGIRILNQDLWEMTVTFLISQQNNIKRIRRCVETICEKYGRRCESDGGKVYYAFPTPEVLSGLDPDALMECNLGYRSKYVVDTARRVISGEYDMEAIKQMDYSHAREELMKLFGVGKKVADCIVLFALHHIEAFPIDTHINRILTREYPQGFPFERYEGFQGVIQQYMFYYDIAASMDANRAHLCDQDCIH